MSIDISTAPAPAPAPDEKRPALPATGGGHIETLRHLRALRPWFNGNGAMAYDDSVDGDRRDNTRRAGYVIPALDAIAEVPDIEITLDDAPADAIAELLAGLRHLCDSLGLDYRQVAKRGRDTYVAELFGRLSDC